MEIGPRHAKRRAGRGRAAACEPVRAELFAGKSGRQAKEEGLFRAVRVGRPPPLLLHSSGITRKSDRYSRVKGKTTLADSPLIDPLITIQHLYQHPQAIRHRRPCATVHGQDCRRDTHQQRKSRVISRLVESMQAPGAESRAPVFLPRSRQSIQSVDFSDALAFCLTRTSSCRSDGRTPLLFPTRYRCVVVRR